MAPRLVNSSERKKPPTSSTTIMTGIGVAGVNVAQAARKPALTTALTVVLLVGGELAQDGCDTGLHGHGAERRAERDQAGLEGREPEPELQQQWQQERD